MKKYVVNKFLLLGVIFVIFSSCSKSADNKRIVAVIGNEKIYEDEVDSKIQNSLYEFLFGIFRVRSLALKDLIDARLLAKEALSKGISVDLLISAKLVSDGKHTSLETFMKENSLDSGVIDPQRPFKTLPANSSEGMAIIKKTYRDYFVENYLQELREKYNVKVQLSPPVSPAVDMSGVKFRSRNGGNNPPIWIISDFTCSSCAYYENTLEAFYQRYNRRFEFRYVHLADNVNKSIKIAECANEQGKFWETYRELFKSHGSEIANLEAIAKNVGLDREKCSRCVSAFNDSKLLDSFRRLNELKLTGTPTILIDNRIYFGELTIEALSQHVEKIGKR